MQSHWDYSPRTETLRLLQAGHNIASGFYRTNNFLVLPFPVSRPSGNVVVYPDLPYLSIPRYWHQCARLSCARLDLLCIPFTAPDPLLHSLQSLLVQAHLPPADFSAIQQLWTAWQSQIMAEIYRLLPSHRNLIKDITFWPTRFGTPCSFGVVKNNPSHLFIWLRQDATLATIFEAVLSALTRADVYTQLGGNWSESEMVVDWLLAYSPLRPLIDKIDPGAIAKTLTLKTTRQLQQAKLARQSQTFLTRLGAPVLNIDTIKRIDTTILSPREKEIFNLLLNNSPCLVSLDDIADTIYAGCEEKFSLFAISKTIERLRNRLEKQGISGSFIQTHRGQGYYLSA